jgi:Mn-dependent DtxR family transcriptional regulator
LQEIFDSYKRNQISRSSANHFYVRKLKEIGKPIRARDFAEKIGKSKRVVNHYFVRLIRKGLIKVDKTKLTYLYFVE